MPHPGEITIYLSEDATRRLHRISALTDRSQRELCEAAVEEECLNFFRLREDDPVRKSK